MCENHIPKTIGTIKKNCKTISSHISVPASRILQLHRLRGLFRDMELYFSKAAVEASETSSHVRTVMHALFRRHFQKAQPSTSVFPILFSKHLIAVSTCPLVVIGRWIRQIWAIEMHIQLPSQNSDNSCKSFSPPLWTLASSSLMNFSQIFVSHEFRKGLTGQFWLKVPFAIAISW